MKNIYITNEDCMKLLKRSKENEYDLAIVDVPYGIGFGEYNRTNKKTDGTRVKANKYKNSKWDESIPKDEYWEELFRVSNNVIAWGGNYIPYLWKNGCKGFIYWHKGNPVDNFSDGELAWTSFDKPAKQFDFRYYGNIEGKTSATTKIHPTQKPVALYSWLLKNYAKPNQKILDTHLGSGSIAIAIDQANKIEGMNLTLTACELDKDYYNDAIKRIESECNWSSVFTEEPKKELIQRDIFQDLEEFNNK